MLCFLRVALPKNAACREPCGAHSLRSGVQPVKLSPKGAEWVWEGRLLPQRGSGGPPQENLSFENALRVDFSPSAVYI